MSIKSISDNSREWKMWHGFNYFLGGCGFLLGSIVLFPFVEMHIDTAQASAWLFIIGSFGFLLGDLAVCLHYTRPGCPEMQLSLNSFLSLFSSLLYSIGSVYLIPGLDLAWLGALFFVTGSGLVVVSQGWKLYRLLWLDNRPIWDIIGEDESGFCVEAFFALGGLLYFIGTFVFYYSFYNPNLLIPGVTIYSFGGHFYFASALFVQKKYFFEIRPDKEYARAETNITSSDL